jgi:hypothetical protein
MVFWLAACGGTYDPNAPFATADAGPDQIARQQFDTMIAPLMVAQCDSCHEAGLLMAPIFASTYESVTTYVPTAGSPDFLSCTSPAASFLITGANTDHAGPAFGVNDEPVVVQWIQMWAQVSPACTGGVANRAVTGPITLVTGTNTVPLDGLGTGLTGATIQFVAQEVGGGLLIDNVQVTAGASGLHVKHPVFEACNTAPPAIVDAVDTFAATDLTVPAGQTAVVGSQAVAMTGVPITARLGIAFDILTPEAGSQGPPIDLGGACAP